MRGNTNSNNIKIDSSVTQSSSNPVTSSGIFQAILDNVWKSTEVAYPELSKSANGYKIYPAPKYPCGGTWTTDSATYYQYYLKQICIDYPNKNDILFIGAANPNSIDIIGLYIYDTGDVSNGLPRYALGFRCTLGGSSIIGTFGTVDYNYYIH